MCLAVWLQHSLNTDVSLGKRERIEKVSGTHTDTLGLAPFAHLICIFHPFKFAGIGHTELHTRKGHCPSPEGFSLTTSGVILILQEVNLAQRPYLGSSGCSAAPFGCTGTPDSWTQCWYLGLDHGNSPNYLLFAAPDIHLQTGGRFTTSSLGKGRTLFLLSVCRAGFVLRSLDSQPSQPALLAHRHHHSDTAQPELLN